MPKYKVKTWAYFGPDDPIPPGAVAKSWPIEIKETIMRKREGFAGVRPIINSITTYIIYEYEIEINVSEEEFQAMKKEGF